MSLESNRRTKSEETSLRHLFGICPNISMISLKVSGLSDLREDGQT